MAGLHSALASYSDEEARDRTWQNDPLTEVFDQQLPNLSSLLTEEEDSDNIRAVAGMESPMQRALKGLPEQLIHRDCHPGNVLMEGRDVVGFVDCDHISIGSPVLDMGYFLIHIVKWHSEDAVRTSEWLRCIPLFLQGYDEVRRVSVREREALPYMMVYVLVMFADLFCNASHQSAARVELTALSYVVSNFNEICTAASESGR